MSKTDQQSNRLYRRQQAPLKPLALAISILFLGAIHTTAQADAGVTDLGTLRPDNTGHSNAWGVNAAGDVVVGQASNTSSYHAFRWTVSANTMTDLGTLATNHTSGYSAANGVNATGDVVVGYAYASITGGYHAFLWTASTNTMTDLGTLVANHRSGNSTANGVNARGDVVVGDADTDNSATHAFRWTQATGMTDLGTLTDNTGYSSANGVNAAGDVVVGVANTGNSTTHAFRWTVSSNTMTDLGTLAANHISRTSTATGINAVGDVVVGAADTDSGSSHAVRWTFTSGSPTVGTMTDLGLLATGNAGYSTANGVNAAGDVVVGRSVIDGGDLRAFRWTSATGMRSIEDWLSANGVAVNASAPKTSIAYGVNAAGNVVVGQLANEHAFIATTKGLLDQVENNKSLAGSAGTPSHALQDAGLVMHGAHGSPMRGLLSAGKQDVWAAGDLGHSEVQGKDGRQGAGEVGYARGVTDEVMLKFALGRTDSTQDTLFGGNTQVTGTYVMPEIIAKLGSTPLYATLSGYYNWGDADVTRGYDNAGTREYGHGTMDTLTSSVRARLDWLDALKYGNTAFTPYTSVTYTQTKLDAYRETGGAFPASWNSRSEHSSEARLGLDAVHGLDDKLNLLGRLEGVHRFNSQGAAATGDVAGLYGFSLPGQTYKRDWLRAAVGVEGKIGKGTGSLMINGSTQSDSSKYWLAASYRMDF